MPSFAAASSKARLLYQPGVPHFFSVPAFSNDTPIVLAPYPKVAILISNHVDIIKTVRIAVKVIQNPTIRDSFNGLENRLKSGQKLSAALNDNEYLPQGLVSRLRVGEESGTSGEMLIKAANHVESDTRRQIKRLLSMFEPLVIVALALVVMVVVLSIFMAIMELNTIES